MVVPYITDNFIKLNTKHQQACWIGPASSVAKSLQFSLDDKEKSKFFETMNYQLKRNNQVSVYQLLTKSWILVEYDLAGMIQKRTDFSKRFRQLKILTCDE